MKELEKGGGGGGRIKKKIIWSQRYRERVGLIKT